jgi:TonB family protein
MKLSCKILAALAAVLLFAVPTLFAQNSVIPDAPAAPAPQTQKTLVLPSPGSMSLLPDYSPAEAKGAEAHKAEVSRQVCSGEPSGVYTLANQNVPNDLRGQLQVYYSNVFSRVLSNWRHKYKSGAQFSAFAHAKVVELRVAIRPDGSFFEPQITHSSGNNVDDAKALAAVRDNDAFPPLPRGLDHPVVLCMKFGYNTYDKDLEMDYDKK